jgi:hypothetical protein
MRRGPETAPNAPWIASDGRSSFHGSSESFIYSSGRHDGRADRRSRTLGVHREFVHSRPRNSWRAVQWTVRGAHNGQGAPHEIVAESQLASKLRVSCRDYSIATRTARVRVDVLTPAAIRSSPLRSGATRPGILVSLPVLSRIAPRPDRMSIVNCQLSDGKCAYRPVIVRNI